MSIKYITLENNTNNTKNMKFIKTKNLVWVTIILFITFSITTIFLDFPIISSINEILKNDSGATYISGWVYIFTLIGFLFTVIGWLFKIAININKRNFKDIARENFNKKEEKDQERYLKKEEKDQERHNILLKTLTELKESNNDVKIEFAKITGDVKSKTSIVDHTELKNRVSNIEIKDKDQEKLIKKLGKKIGKK